MQNIFSANEPTRQVEPEFSNQAQTGTSPIAPGCNPIVPGHPHVQLAPKFEDLARRTAPGSAVSKELTYTWRK
jgi:hypothetical protein